MLLREVLSNFSPALIKVTKGGRKKKPQVSDVRERRTLVQPNRKLSPTEIDDLVARYLGGDTLAGLGRHFGMHEQTVRMHLRRRSVELRGRQALSSGQIREVVRRYEAGESSVDLGLAFGLASSTICHVLRRAGAEVRPTGTRYPAAKRRPRQ